ncbi:MAG TPA: CPBP family glutamic-type intramembrane protease [Candidatus Polarisedimenticolaceae bacterium]|nr:CPBP family glutamic-type intramembrane protease [Candidatus Polarisedimenticolaceae bacterium]
MRVPRWLAWLLIAIAMFTAGLLRQSHDLTPTSPFLAPAVGSLLFACVVFLVLVALRERQIGPAPGPGVRLGSLTPLMLMLLVEKWFSSNFYQPAFVFLAPDTLTAEAADAWFRLICGVGLILVVVALAAFSRPARAFVTSRLGGWKLVTGTTAAAAAVLAAGVALAAVARAAGSSVGIVPPDTYGPWNVVVLGQSAIALGEETYYRGLLLGELLRLGPRLGLASPSLRRWVALGMTSLMFGMEHLGPASSFADGLRQVVFAIALGSLLGLLTLVTRNLWFSASMHAWINFLLLGAAPGLAYGAGRAQLPPGATVSLALIGAFVAAFVLQRRRQSTVNS